MERAEGAHHPPPYNPYDYGQRNHAGVGWQEQDGKGNISVVYAPGSYHHTNYTVDPEAPPSTAVGFDPPPGYSCEEEDGVFSDGNVRRGFIKKVYLILMLQLLVTVGIICAFLYWPELREWTWDNSWFPYVMLVTTLILVICMSCCDSLRRRVPLNFIALGLFTIAEGLMLGALAAFFNAEAVMWAMGATALVSLALSLFAFQTKFDFTMLNGVLWVFLWTLLSFCLLCAILRSQYLYIVYACLGTLLFSVYLVFDTQLILGGKHRKYEVSPEEYVFAALNLYLDIVTLFLLLLQLIGLCR